MCIRDRPSSCRWAVAPSSPRAWDRTPLGARRTPRGPGRLGRRLSLPRASRGPRPRPRPDRPPTALVDGWRPAVVPRGVFLTWRDVPLAPAAPHSGPTASCWPLAAGTEWGGATITACALRCRAGPARAGVMGTAAARATEIGSGTRLPSGWWTSTRFHSSSPPPLGAHSAELGERPPQRREDNPPSGPPPLQAQELAVERPQHGGQGVPCAHDVARGA